MGEWESEVRWKGERWRSLRCADANAGKLAEVSQDREPGPCAGMRAGSEIYPEDASSHTVLQTTQHSISIDNHTE